MVDISLGGVPPIFAHDVGFSTIVKSKKTKDNKVKKEAFTELIFIDGVRKAALARIVLPMTVLEELPERINESLKKLKQDLKNKEMPKSIKNDGEKTDIKNVGGNYVG